MSITKSLAKRLTNYDSQQSVGTKLRTKRIALLLKIINTVYIKYGCANIIDIGGTEQYWGIIDQQYFETYNVKITIVNLPGSKLPDDHGPFTFVHADGCNLTDFINNSFHIAHSNSVIEHVGDWNQMVKFSNELKRVAHRYFIQTPNYWFPIEPHCMTPFFHWLPKPTRVWLVMNYSLGNWRKETSVGDAVKKLERHQLLNHKMFHELFNDAIIRTERVFLMPKSYIALRE